MKNNQKILYPAIDKGYLDYECDPESDELKIFKDQKGYPFQNYTRKQKEIIIEKIISACNKSSEEYKVACALRSNIDKVHFVDDQSDYLTNTIQFYIQSDADKYGNIKNTVDEIELLLFDAAVYDYFARDEIGVELPDDRLDEIDDWMSVVTKLKSLPLNEATDFICKNFEKAFVCIGIDYTNYTPNNRFSSIDWACTHPIYPSIDFKADPSFDIPSVPKIEIVKRLSLFLSLAGEIDTIQDKAQVFNTIGMLLDDLKISSDKGNDLITKGKYLDKLSLVDKDTEHLQNSISIYMKFNPDNQMPELHFDIYTANKLARKKRNGRSLEEQVSLLFEHYNEVFIKLSKDIEGMRFQ